MYVLLRVVLKELEDCCLEFLNASGGEVEILQPLPSRIGPLTRDTVHYAEPVWGAAFSTCLNRLVVLVLVGMAGVGSVNLDFWVHI